MNLEIDLLRTFVAICETGSFRAASEVVARTQSAVSLQVKRLEEDFGEILFDRDPQGIRPTTRGEQLLSHARQILQAHDEAVMSIDRRRSDDRELRLGIGADFGQALLGRVLDVIRTDLPNLTLEIFCGPSEELGAQLREGRLEIAFLDEGEGIAQGPVVHRERCVWASGGEVHRLDPVPLALVPQHCLYRRWATDRLDAAGKPYRIIATAHSIGALTAIVRGGHAVATLAEGALTPGMRVLEEADGFPALPMIDVRVDRSRVRDSKWLRNLHKTLMERLRLDV